MTDHSPSIEDKLGEIHDNFDQIVYELSHIKKHGILSLQSAVNSSLKLSHVARELQIELTQWFKEEHRKLTADK